MTPMLGSFLVRSAESQRMLSPNALGHPDPRVVRAYDLLARSHNRIPECVSGLAAGVMERVAIAYAERSMRLLPRRLSDPIPAETTLGCQDPAARPLSSGTR